jgi:hypothetical protein
MKTNLDLHFYKGAYSAIPDNVIFVAKGAPVNALVMSGRFYYIAPQYFPVGSIHRHDATYYGFQVEENQIDFEGEAIA